MSLRRAVGVMLGVSLALTACQGKLCTAATADAGCPPPINECVDAGVELPCPALNRTCGCCFAPASECTLLQCGNAADGGLAWQWVRAIAPEECRPGS